MDIRKNLELKLKNLDIASLPDKQIEAMLALLQKKSNNRKTEIGIDSSQNPNKNSVNYELKNNEEKFRKIYENINDVIFTMDFNGILTSINPVAEQLVGYTFEEVVDHNVKKYFTSETVKNILKKLKGKKEHTIYEMDFINNDGSLTSFEVNSVLRYKDNKPYEILGIARDITERKRINYELKKSEEKFREIYENTNDVVFTMDFDGNVTSINPVVEKLIGYKFENLTDYNIRKYFTPESVERASYNIAKKLKDEKEHTIYEMDLLNKEGSLTSFEVNSMLRYKDGKPYEIFGIARDITERKQINIVLKKSEEKFREIYDNINDAIFTMNLNYKITSYNPAALKLLGYTPEEFKDPDLRKYLTNDSKSKMLDNLDKKLKGKKEQTVYELDMIRKDGSVRTFEINSKLKYKDGNPYKVFSISRDITERKIATDLLKKSEEKYRLIFEDAPIGIMAINADGDITEINSNLMQLLGPPSVDEIKKMNVFKSQVLIDAGLSDIFKKSIKTGLPITLEKSYTSTWGKQIFVRIYTKPIKNINDKITGLQMLFDDIRKQKAIEDQIKSALTEKEVLLREIHHRVKNNMQIIISLIRMQMQDFTDPLLIKKLMELQQRVRTMSVIHDELYMSGNLSLINFETYLHKLSNNLLCIYSLNFDIDLQLKVADLKMDIDSAIPLGLIVNELISNSLKYAFPEEWRAKNKKEYQIYVEFTSDADKFLLIVGDNGIGIPENIEEIKTKTLGLLLVEMLANQLKGSLSVSNHNGVRYEIAIEKEEGKKN
jgi:PAS domain S-box-containing protein